MRNAEEIKTSKGYIEAMAQMDEFGANPKYADLAKAVKSLMPRIAESNNNLLTLDKTSDAIAWRNTCAKYVKAQSGDRVDGFFRDLSGSPAQYAEWDCEIVTPPGELKSGNWPYVAKK